MNRIDRLFALQNLIQSRKYVTAETIAKKFRISLRTVYRDIKALCESGVPVSFEAARGYYIVQGYFLAPVSFSTEEAAALMLMEGATRFFADRGIQELYASALTKVRSVLRAAQKDGIEYLDESTGIQFPACMEATYDHLSALQQCIALKKMIEICYRAKDETESTRRLEPIGLMFYAMAWHLIAWCHKRNDYRDFRVSRIVTLRRLDLPFTREDHISLKEFAQDLPVSY